MATIRFIRSDDYEKLQQMEAEIFGKAGYPLVGSYYLRVCTELFADSCFLAFANELPVGYVLTFVNGDVAYCTRLGVVDKHQGSSAAIQLIAATVDTLIRKNVRLLWFTVRPDNTHARKLYRKIGAVERGTRRDFFVPGDELLLLEMDGLSLQRFSEKSELAWGLRA